MERLRQEKYSLTTYDTLLMAKVSSHCQAPMLYQLMIIFNITCMYLNDIKDTMK